MCITQGRARCVCRTCVDCQRANNQHAAGGVGAAYSGQESWLTLRRRECTFGEGGCTATREEDYCERLLRPGHVCSADNARSVVDWKNGDTVPLVGIRDCA